MIIATHKEIDADLAKQIVQPTLLIQRTYTDSDIILKQGVDFIEAEIGTITMLVSDLEQNLKYIYRDAYQKGRNDAIEQMIHG